jgi:hypothetical protein
MEKVRLEASRILDRSIRLTEREFEVSAEAWSLVFEVYIRTMSAMPGFRQYPDLEHASDEVVRRVAAGADLDEFEINELIKRPGNERNKYYSDRMRAHEIWDAKKAVQTASHYLAKKALFLEKDVHSRLTEFVDRAWTAIVDQELVWEMRGQGPIPKDLRRDDEEFRKTGESKIKDLEQFVRERFWDRPTVQSPDIV